MIETYESNPNVCYTCHYHVGGCPKERRKVLVQAIATRLGRSSRLRTAWRSKREERPTLWTNSSVVGTTSGALLSSIKQSIEQHKHG